MNWHQLSVSIRDRMKLSPAPSSIAHASWPIRERPTAPMHIAGSRSGLGKYWGELHTAGFLPTIISHKENALLTSCDIYTKNKVLCCHEDKKAQTTIRLSEVITSLFGFCLCPYWRYFPTLTLKTGISTAETAKTLTEVLTLCPLYSKTK